MPGVHCKQWTHIAIICLQILKNNVVKGLYTTEQINFADGADRWQGTTLLGTTVTTSGASNSNWEIVTADGWSVATFQDQGDTNVNARIYLTNDILDTEEQWVDLKAAVKAGPSTPTPTPTPSPPPPSTVPGNTNLAAKSGSARLAGQAVAVALSAIMGYVLM